MKFLVLKNNIVFWLFILLPILWIFRNIFLGDLPTWGDAPYYYSEGLKELFSEPQTWITRNVSFGGVNTVLWISPMMFLMGLLFKIFSFGNDALMRIVFYFPSVLLLLLGGFSFGRYLKLTRLTLFFSLLFYSLNTYFLLLIDGGQIGIALSYGLFPWAILLGKKMVDGLSIKSFFLFLSVLFILSTIDPRIMLIALFTLLVWQLFENRRKIFVIMLSSILLIPLNFYWIYPLLKIGSEFSGLYVSELKLTSFLNSLLVYAPHWSANIFGKVIQPDFYFIFIPLIIFLGALLKRNKRNLIFFLLFLVFAFFSKGTSDPFGRVYEFILNFPFGSAFRDSTKFFIPLVLFAGILFGEGVESLYLKLKSKVVVIASYVFLLALICPAIFGKLNFNLSQRIVKTDHQVVYENLNKDSGNFKTLWFPQKHPLTFESLQKPAISAMDLVLLKPFAFINASNDVYNFLNNSEYIDWLKVLGVKYIFLSGDTRNINPSQSEVKNWQTISALIDKTPGLKKLDWGLTFPGYVLDGSYPVLYSVRSLVGVIGPMLEGTTPSIYFEDGKLDPNLLSEQNMNSLKLYFNGKDNNDLIMSFLQKYFVSSLDNISSQWAVFDKNQYLNAKYELLIRGYEYRDFDYGKGIAFSTNKEEKISFRIKIPKSDKYILAVRKSTSKEQNFFWTLEEKILTKGSFLYDVENKSGLEVLNVIAIIPSEDFEVARNKAKTFIEHFGVVSKKDLMEQDRKDIYLKPEGTLKYKLESPQEGYWIILSQNYHPLWSLKRGIDYFESVPVYSMVNGFYVDPRWGDLHIEFLGQNYFRWGIWVGTLTALGLLIIFIFLVGKNNERKNKTDIGN